MCVCLCFVIVTSWGKILQFCNVIFLFLWTKGRQEKWLCTKCVWFTSNWVKQMFNIQRFTFIFFCSCCTVHIHFVMFFYCMFGLITVFLCILLWIFLWTISKYIWRTVCLKYSLKFLKHIRHSIIISTHLCHF